MTPARTGQLLMPLRLAALLMIWDTPYRALATPGSPQLAAAPPIVSPTDSYVPHPSNGVTIDEAGSRRKIEDASGPRGRVPPGSPVNLFTPDEFQFYTLNGNGQLVMKQMTKQEIQGMIAVGGGSGSVSLPVDMGHHHAQLSAEEPKVSDVVQNVQKVLKGELNKPVEIHNSVTSIPGSVNSQWTNMLPYILSGGSVDQQDVSQDENILLSTLEDDQPYIDIVPFHSSHLTDSNDNPIVDHVPDKITTNAQETKATVPDLTMTSSEKPIYLLGNMELDSGILGEQETYDLPTKLKPSKTTAGPAYNKFTTTRPSLSVTTNENANNLKTSTSNKPTLHTPLSASSSIKSEIESQSSNDPPNNLNSNTIINKNVTKTPVLNYQGITKTNPPKKTNIISEFTKIPIQMLVSAFDKISTSTQHTKQQTSTFDKVSTIASDPDSNITIPLKNETKPSKVNLGPMGGFKRPAPSYKPTSSFRPVYDRPTVSNTGSFTSQFSHRPVYEKPNKANSTNILSTTRPGYESRRPVYKPTTKPSNIRIIPTSTHHTVYNSAIKTSTIPIKPASSYRPVQFSSIKPLTGVQSAHYSSSKYTTRKPSTPFLGVVTKPSEESDNLDLLENRTTDIENNTTSTEESVTKYSIKKQEIKATEHEMDNSEKSSSNFDAVTNPSITTDAANITEYHLDPTEKIAILTITSTNNPSFQTEEKIIGDQNMLLLDNDQQNKRNDSTMSYIINKYDQNTDSYRDTTYKLPEKTTDSSELYKDIYSTDHDNDNVYSTTIAVKDSETPTTIYVSTDNSEEPDLIKTVTPIQPSEKTESYTGYEDYSTKIGITQSEESSTKMSSDYYTTIVKDNTKEYETTLEETDSLMDKSKETISSTSEINKNADYTPIHQKNTIKESISTFDNSKPEKTYLDTINEKTTQFIPVTEDIIDYYTMKYDFGETKEPSLDQTTIQEAALSKQESIADSLNDNMNYEKLTETDPVIDYTTAIMSSEILNNADNYVKDELNEKKNSQQINNNYEEYTRENVEFTTKPLEYLNKKYEPESISTEDYTPAHSNPIKITTETYNFYKQSDDKLTTEDSVTSYENKEKHSPTVSLTGNIMLEQREELKTKPETKIIGSTIKYSTAPPQILTTEDTNYVSNISPSKNTTYTSANQIEETTTEVNIQLSMEKEQQNIVQPSLLNTKINTTNTIHKMSLEDNEASTVKVIPVYDDDMSLYTITFDSPGQTTYHVRTQKPFKQTKIPELSVLNKENQPTTLDQEQPSTILFTTPLTKNTAQTDSTESTILPGLQETFNNYMKEHYDPSVSTAENYDEISQLTTFPTTTNKVSSNIMDKLSQFASTILDFKTTIIPKHQNNQQKLQTDEMLTTVIPNLMHSDSTDFYSSTESVNNFNYSKLGNIDIVDSTTLETINIMDNLAENPNNVKKQSDMNIKHSVETPIIYLDLVSPKTDKNNLTYQLPKDHITNSSLTRIKIKNPVLEIDQILSDLTDPTNTPLIVDYTLPHNNVSANNVASGLIAGYPTYSQAKPITEFVTHTTTPLQMDHTNIPSLSHVQEYKNEDIQKDSNFNYQETLLTTLSGKNDNYSDQIKTSTPIDPTTNESSNELFTKTAYETLPVQTGNPNKTIDEDDSINTTFNPTLEKISDLINQLQHSPSKEDSIRYNYSNGIITTSSPLEKSDIIINKNISATSNETLTILNTLNQSSTELKNTTYKQQTPLPNYTSDAYPNSIQTTIRSTTIKEASTTAKTHSIKLKEKFNPNASTILNIVKQQVMGKPYIPITHSTKLSQEQPYQSTIDKSAGRINLEEERNKTQLVKPTEASRFTLKNKFHYNSVRRPTTEKYSNHKNTTKQTIRTSTIAITEGTTPKTIVNVKEVNADKWTLNAQKPTPEQAAENKKPASNVKEPAPQMKQQIVALDHATGAIGLDQSNKGLDADVAEFLNTCNEMAFKFWTLANSGLSSSRSVTMSPFGMISTLAMIFLGARGLTSNQMNDILKLDDVVTFNPHLVFQNITDTVTLARGQGIENAAFVRALFADRLKVRRIMPFYKEQAQQFYEGAVVDINFSTAGDILRRRTNLLIRKQTGGRIKDFVKGHTVSLRSPLTALSANVFQTSCDGPDASIEGRDGEMYFAVSQTVKQRKLMPIPAVVWKSGVSAGYEPSLDATAVALGDSKRPVSLIMIMPGQQGVTAPGDNLERLENRLFGNPSENALEKLLKVIIPRRVELQMPKFSHRSIVNVTSALKKMGFDQLFTRTADLKGINGAGHDLYLADMLQMNLFCTCGDENKLGSRHLSETYPGTSTRHMRASEIIDTINNKTAEQSENTEADHTEASENSDCNENDTNNSSGLQNANENAEITDKKFDSISNVRQKLSMKKLRWFLPTWRKRCRNKRQTESEKPRMKMDKPFLYLIRHNLTGFILHIGRFNPKNQS